MDCLKFKEVADNNFRCGYNGGKFNDMIKRRKKKKNIERKGEITGD